MEARNTIWQARDGTLVQGTISELAKHKSSLASPDPTIVHKNRLMCSAHFTQDHFISFVMAFAK